jgi:hypothetical protein
MTDFTLQWVLPEPNRERAVDALGTSAVAGWIADQLVPNFSAQTERARYASLLCAAVRKAESTARPIAVIHRIEAEQAVHEAAHHDGEPASACPGVVGRQLAHAELRRLGWVWPTRPESLYKSTAFNRYRPLLRSLGLLTGTRGTRLTEAGRQLARTFPLNGSQARRCLNEITKGEQRMLIGPLGLDGRAAHDVASPRAIRRDTYDYMRRTGVTAGPALLLLHERPPRKPDRVATALHRAYAWELISVGLLAGLRLLLDQQRLSKAAAALGAALRQKPSPDLQGELDPDDAARHAVALLREAHRVEDAVPDRGAGHLTLARTLVVDRDPVTFLRRIVEQHQRAKGGDAWFHLPDDRVVVLAHGKNLDVRLVARSYRLDAYAQFLRDLGKL